MPGVYGPAQAGVGRTLVDRMSFDRHILSHFEMCCPTFTDYVVPSRANRHPLGQRRESKPHPQTTSNTHDTDVGRGMYQPDRMLAVDSKTLSSASR